LVEYALRFVGVGAIGRHDLPEPIRLLADLLAQFDDLADVVSQAGRGSGE
jgi:hypothetical protein